MATRKAREVIGGAVLTVEGEQVFWYETHPTKRGVLLVYLDGIFIGHIGDTAVEQLQDALRLSK